MIAYDSAKIKAAPAISTLFKTSSESAHSDHGDSAYILGTKIMPSDQQMRMDWACELSHIAILVVDASRAVKYMFQGCLLSIASLEVLFSNLMSEKQDHYTQFAI